MRKNNTSKIIISIILIFNMIFMTSCRLNVLSQPWSMDRESIRVGKAILNALSEHDEEAFRDLFCEKVKEKEDFSKQVKEVMRFFEGEIEEFPEEGDLTASGGEAWDDGVLNRMDIFDDIENIKTSQKKVFSIQYYAYVVNKEEPKKEGVIYITIKGEGKEFTVGGLK